MAGDSFCAMVTFSPAVKSDMTKTAWRAVRKRAASIPSVASLKISSSVSAGKSLPLPARKFDDFDKAK
jgi:hypothetical protein